MRWEADQLIDAGEHVVVFGTIYYGGRDGIETTASIKQVWTIREVFVRWHARDSDCYDVRTDIPDDGRPPSGLENSAKRV